MDYGHCHGQIRATLLYRQWYQITQVETGRGAVAAQVAHLAPTSFYGFYCCARVPNYPAV